MAMNGKKSKKKIVIISVIGLVVVALLLIVFLGSKKEPIVAVQIEKAQRRNITQVVTATGKIQPEVQVKISPEVSGEIVSLPVKEGQRVKKGDLLLKIKPDVYVAQRDQFAAGLLSARANLTGTSPSTCALRACSRRGLFQGRSTIRRSPRMNQARRRMRRQRPRWTRRKRTSGRRPSSRRWTAR